MSFSWAEYLSVAQQLCSVPLTGPLPGIEARQRAGVSRAYYAAYASARNRLRDVDGMAVPGGGRSHHFVAEQYEHDPEPSRIKVGIQLHRLRAARNRCDYDDTVARLPRVARRSLTRAAAILADLGRLGIA